MYFVLYFVFAIAFYFLFIFSIKVQMSFDLTIASLTRGWTWIAVFRQCFSSGRAADGHIPYKARSSQNWPKNYRVRSHPIDFHKFCTWFRCRVLCDRGFTSWLWEVNSHFILWSQSPVTFTVGLLNGCDLFVKYWVQKNPQLLITTDVCIFKPSGK